MSADIGIVGLAVMGENLTLNMATHGFTVAVFNRTTSRVDDFISGRAKGHSIIGSHSIEELVSKLKKPRRVMLMVRAGKPIDDTINQIIPHLSAGDIIIDGGNSNHSDTTRRIKELASRNILFIGTGVSGGEEGALNGPSIMPGGSQEAWPHVKSIFQSISAKVEDGSPCCDWIGSEGAGHFVKTVHNGHEYACCQIIAEAYDLLKNVLNIKNDEISKIFGEWNKGDLDSYLIEITASIFSEKDENGEYVIDYILDAAGQKGTGKWTVFSALDIGIPVTMVCEAVFARCLSSRKPERVVASGILSGPHGNVQIETMGTTRQEFINCIRDAVYGSFLTSCAQCFVLMKAVSMEYNWNIDFGNVALMWRGGCIIRSKYLKNIYDAFKRSPELPNLLFDDFFAQKIQQSLIGWRKVVIEGVKAGIPLPAMSSGLAYYDGLRRSRGPSNLIQAQRDYFGAHTYERIDKPQGQNFHTDWTGHGGSTHSNLYNV